jgi:hypothetical protein
MHEICHRCLGPLPIVAPGNKQSSDDAMLFCPRCSAPQILLPEHMRSENDAAATIETTGATPPPRPHSANANQDPKQVDWRAALSAAGLVALVAAALRIAELKFDVVALVWFFWLLCGANLGVGYYARKRPTAWMDARVGMRIGLVTGVLMCATMAVVSGAAGVVVRYGLHGMTAFDQQQAEETKAMQGRVQVWMQHTFDAEQQKDYEARMNSPLMKSPEMLAGSALFGAGFWAVILVAISAGTGAVNGMMRGLRLSRRSRGL